MNLVKELTSFFKRDNSTEKECNFYRTIFNHTKIGFIIYTADTLEVVDTNQSIKTLLELPPDNSLNGLYISQVMMRYLSGDSPNMEILMNDINKDWTGEVLFVTHNKNKFYAKVNTNILSGEPGSKVRILSVIDNSIFVESQKEVRKAKETAAVASQSKARFLSSMSHELRTPLNGIVGASDLILEDIDLTDKVKKHISVIKYSSEHMLGIINGILDFTKIDAHKMKLIRKPFSILECLDNIIEEFMFQFKEQTIELKGDYAGQGLEGIELIGDGIKLGQILKNLLGNALKFTITGEVDLIVRKKEMKDSSITLFFEVKDSGIGIPEDKLDDIFEAFEQIFNDELKRRYQGTGLGLTISSQLVKMMGGKLEVKSTVGRGSRFFFTVTFPVHSQSDQELKDIQAAKTALDEIELTGVRALIVEDNEINASILRRFLNKWGMPVKEAITGVHALELLKYHEFDIILMDLEMPEMDGYTALKKLREKGLTVPVIAFTATLIEDLNSLITEAGFNDYISKPFKPAELKRKIGKFCSRKVGYI